MAKVMLKRLGQKESKWIKYKLTQPLTWWGKWDRFWREITKMD